MRQGDYKYTYSDNSNIALKSEKADLVVSAVERFAQVIPLNIEEIFLWYFEQKGVDNPERFLGINNNRIDTNPSVQQVLEPEPSQNNINPLMQVLSLIKQNSKKDFDISDVISKIKRNKQTRKETK